MRTQVVSFTEYKPMGLVILGDSLPICRLNKIEFIAGKLLSDDRRLCRPPDSED